MSSAALRRALFNRGADAVANVFPGLPRCYICPLCTHEFPEGALAEDLLTLEHAPPAALGGRRILLTCRVCNSRAGHELDAHMTEFDRRVAFTRGMSKQARRGQLRMDERQVNVDVRIEGNNVLVFGLPKSNRPGALETWAANLSEMVDSGRTDWQGSLVWQGTWKPRAVRIGWLRASYLLAFAALGYHYAAHPVLQLVRQQIAQPAVEVLRGFYLVDTAAQTSRRGMYVVDLADSSVRCLLVAIGQRLTVLPWFESPSNLYDQMAEGEPEAKQFRANGVAQVPWPETLELRLDWPVDATQ